MSKPIYVPHQGDLFEIQVDARGVILGGTVYRDNRNNKGEPIDLRFLPRMVYEKVQNKVANERSNNDTKSGN